MANSRSSRNVSNAQNRRSPRYNSAPRADIATAVTNRIIEQMESGIIPWHKPWNSLKASNDMAVNHVTGKPYSLLNQLLLGEPGEYLTFDRAIKEGGHVRHGAKARTVVFWKFLHKDQTDANGNALLDDDGDPLDPMTIPYLKYINVFHIKDCEGVNPRFFKEDEESTDAVSAELAEKLNAAKEMETEYLINNGISTYNNESACYSPVHDSIFIPRKSSFDTPEAYHATLLHEMVHSTGHPTRLKRFDLNASLAPFGSEDYSKEELVAEIGSACLMNTLGLETPGTFRNSTAYLQSWLKVFKDAVADGTDKYLLISAAGKAEKAARLISGIKEAEKMATDNTNENANENANDNATEVA